MTAERLVFGTGQDRQRAAARQVEAGPGLDPTACRSCRRDSCDGGCSGADAPREFQHVAEGHYRMRVPQLGVAYEADRLRRKSEELWGELTVHTTMPGARTVDGVLSSGNFNFSSQRARQDLARFQADRSRAPEVDWLGLVEEFAQGVLKAERAGQPAVLLRDLPRPLPDETLQVDGFPLLARHPTFIFGDGGGGKSYTSMFIAGRLDQLGKRVGIFDWEAFEDAQRDRAERLFGANLPAIRYVRCTRPLVYEADRLRRIVLAEQLDYAIFDSVGFACDGPPEAAEVAGRYFQAVRQIGSIGSLHLAHISKAEGADQKPFGSVFWHNGARATWFAKLAEASAAGDRMTIGLYNRKNNVGRLWPAVAFEISFTDTQTSFRHVNLSDVPDLAAGLSVRQRMAQLLRRGGMSPEAIAEEIQADVDTVKRTLRRNRNLFTILPGGNLGLAERRT